MDHLKLDLHFAIRGRVRLAHPLAASAAALLVTAPLAAMVPAAGDRVERDRERPQAICWGRNDDAPHLHVERRHDSYLLEWETVGCEVQVRIRGEIGFNSDFTAIARIARGGSVRLIEEAGSSERRLDIEPGPDGLEYTWRVDDREAPFDAAASDWLSEMVLQIFRSVGYAANERSLWFLREHGMPGLLHEIDQLPSSVLADSELGDHDHIVRVYYQVALEQGDVDATGAAQLIKRAGAQIRSDHELSRLLRAAGKRFARATSSLRSMGDPSPGETGTTRGRTNSSDAACAASCPVTPSASTIAATVSRLPRISMFRTYGAPNGVMAH